MRVSFFRIALAGAALAAFSADFVLAQTAPAQNPFSNNQPATPAPNAAKTKKKAAVALKPGEFATEAEAKASCPGETVVWVNTGTKVYHYAGTADYGKTKRGAYMCEKGTSAAGFHAAKNEKKPS